MTIRRPFGLAHVPLFAVSLSASLVLAACGSGDEDYDFETSRTDFETSQATAAASVSAAQTVFDPQNGELPFPNDLLFSGSEDGTLNIPLDDDAAASDPSIALNQLDGFSTVAPISASVTEPLDGETVTLGNTVRVFQVDATPQGGVTGVVRELGATDVAVLALGTQIVILPVQPLQPATRYLAVLTSGIVGADGEALEPSLFYGLAKNTEPYTAGLAAFEPVRQLTQSHLAAAGGAGIDPASVVLSWTFRTQSIREPLQAAADQVTPQALVLAPAPGGLTTSAIGAQGKAAIWVGTLDLPYYQTAADPADPASFGAALNGFWQNAGGSFVNPTDWMPVATRTVTVPVLMTVPTDAAASGSTPPDGGWPVTIFQHGITGDRSQMLAIADAMADAGRVVIAIDQPVHGITASDTAAEGLAGALAQLNAANTPFAETERHFGIDVLNNETRAPGPDGEVDPSGSHFYNLQNLANSRDNLRQAAADLLTLSASIGSAVVPTDTMGGVAPAAAAGLPLNAGSKNFVGHSLGGIVGTTMLSYDTSFQSASLAMPGGGIAQLLANSENFGPVINGGLAAAGIETGSAAYNQFLVAAQTTIDSGDPINHAAFLAQDASTGLHLVQVDGDMTIPNAVATAPLSGTEPMARFLGLPRVAESSAGNRHFVRFSAGDHGSILRPSEGDLGLEATVEMQTQVATFAAALGQQLQITNPAVITPLDDGQ